ncbi:MAG TPA: 50S ribosomal protein L24 [Candidatus Saccharimonadales bacterium]
MKIRQNDTVRVTAGKFKGKIAKVVKVYPKTNKIALEGINLIKRNVKPSQLNPQGGTKEVHTPIAISNVALVVDGKDATSRIGFDIKKDGTKVRVARQAGNKEIK